MSGANLYLPLADIAADAGLTVMVTDTNAGWERRARSSGGFPALPVGVMWHHAACSRSQTDESCVNYQVRGNPDNPVGNLTLGRTGDVWPIAAGASNCSGKGGPMTFSRGPCPQDQGNTYLLNIEVVNDGVGEAWSAELVDAYFAVSNALNAYCGNRPDDVTSHALGDGTGYTDRKVDPAVATSVEGPWRPASVNANGTWSLPDMRAECVLRAGSTPPLPIGDDMPAVMIKGGDNPTIYAWNGTTLAALPPGWDQAGVMFGVIADQPVTVYAQSDIDALLAQQGR